MKNCMASTTTIHHQSDELQEDEMCGACAVYGGEEKCIQSFGGDTCIKGAAWKSCAQDNIKMDFKAVGQEGMP